MYWLDRALAPGEMYVADGGYADGRVRADTPNGLNTADQYMKSKVRARHETVNKRFKEYRCLEDAYRHSLDKHCCVFRPVATIVQLEIEECRPLFDLQYKDN